jgi:hypothetical protein
MKMKHITDSLAGGTLGRRDFLRLSAQTGSLLTLGQAGRTLAAPDGRDVTARASDARSESGHSFNEIYQGPALDQVAFPMGGMGAGMICLEGSGALSKFSLRHRPDLTSEHRTFAAVSVRGLHNGAKLLEGPVPAWKLRPQFPGQLANCWALPRFRQASFEARFPFATVRLRDEQMPLDVDLTGWSPFSPGDSDSASLPVACVEYRFVNRSNASVDAVFSFNTENFMALPQDPMKPDPNPPDRVRSIAGGFVLSQPGDESSSWNEGYFAAWVDEPNTQVNARWFRGLPDDSMRLIWNDIASGNCAPIPADPASASPGASLFVPFTLSPQEGRTIVLHLAWYVPRSNLYQPTFSMKNGQAQKIAAGSETYRPWYAGRFSSVDDVRTYWQSDSRRLREEAAQFSGALFDSTLPAEALEAVATNLSILKSPTVLRQIDGRLWGWEGSYDDEGFCYGSCTHVWNYAQSLAHLFPDLERSLRETELGPNLGADGFQAIRAALPIRPVGDSKEDGLPAAADGQLGGTLKVYRDWRISGDIEWLRRLWPKVRASLDYCIRTWDRHNRGWIEEPHLNTYDFEFWGADSLCTSLYLGALKAAMQMGQALGENVEHYSRLLTKGHRRIEQDLFNGEYFVQRIDWKGLHTPFPPGEDNQLWGVIRQYPAAMKLAEREGPPYQYGEGCLADGVFGAWLSWVCGSGEILDAGKVESHLMAVYRHNFNRRLMDCPDRLRPSLGFGEEAGLVVCSWPRGGRPLLPLVYADEVWTGIEYEVASHLIALGRIEEGLDIVRACRSRYDGRVRNPFAEVEAGHWYARAMSSYALLQAFSGARFDAVDKILYLKPAIKGDFRCFVSTAMGYGTVGVKDGKPFLEVVSGVIPFKEIQYTTAA